MGLCVGVLFWGGLIVLCFVVKVAFGFGWGLACCFGFLFFGWICVVFCLFCCFEFGWWVWCVGCFGVLSAGCTMGGFLGCGGFWGGVWILVLGCVLCCFGCWLLVLLVVWICFVVFFSLLWYCLVSGLGCVRFGGCVYWFGGGLVGFRGLFWVGGLGCLVWGVSWCVWFEVGVWLSWFVNFVVLLFDCLVGLGCCWLFCC